MAGRHKVFLSFHKVDLDRVLGFIRTFDTGLDVFIYRAITMPDDVIKSTDAEYVMSRIRNNFLSDSTVTMVLVGACTWARRFVDWEVQASLRRPADGLPNGLLAVLLDPSARAGVLPPRVRLNVDSGYARFYSYPATGVNLASWIEDAFMARLAREGLRRNPRDRMEYNRACP